MPDQAPVSRFALLFTALAIATLAGCSRTSVDSPEQRQGGAAAPEKEVGTVTLKHETLALSTELPGRTAAPVIAEIRPQVGGILKERLFDRRLAGQGRPGALPARPGPAAGGRTPAPRPACARPSRPWPRRARWRAQRRAGEDRRHQPPGVRRRRRPPSSRPKPTSAWRARPSRPRASSWATRASPRRSRAGPILSSVTAGALVKPTRPRRSPPCSSSIRSTCTSRNRAASCCA
jgi:hypothetical protein